MTKLTYAKLKTLGKGKYHDGNNLYLALYRKGAGKWTFRYHLHKRSREMGLGAYPLISLKDARIKAYDCRHLLSQRIDPIDHHRQSELSKIKKSKRRFSDVAALFIRDRSPSWRNAKHAQQWRNTLQTYAYPVLDRKPLHSLETSDVLDVVRPIWFTKNETAHRVLQRIFNIINYAKSENWYDGANPAHWKERIGFVLPHPREIQKVKPLAFMPYEKVPSLYQKLCSYDTIVALALRLNILTLMRTTEVIRAEFDEFNLEKKYWLIDGSRMKNKEPHKAPLSDEALSIIKRLRQLHNHPYLFVRDGFEKPISNNAMLYFLKRKFPEIKTTVHGFRTSFRTWSEESENHDFLASEMSISHKVLSKTQQAYMRSDLYERRKKIMLSWSKYLVNGK